jgi:hypothetical protein
MRMSVWLPIMDCMFLDATLMDTGPISDTGAWSSSFCESRPSAEWSEEPSVVCRAYRDGFAFRFFVDIRNGRLLYLPSPRQYLVSAMRLLYMAKGNTRFRMMSDATPTRMMIRNEMDNTSCRKANRLFTRTMAEYRNAKNVMNLALFERSSMRDAMAPGGGWGWGGGVRERGGASEASTTE